MGKNCQICGANSGMYPLCIEHMKMKEEGRVLKCTECGKWHLAERPCSCTQKSAHTELPTEGFDSCVLCGTKTKGYAFCKKCFSLHDEKYLLEVLNNGRDKATAKRVEAVSTERNSEKNSVVIINEENKSKCIICGRQTDGLLFCSSCYHRYKTKELLFKITNCSNVELLDEDYEGRYVCKDGHVVKSKSERDIDNYLYEHNITHAYEKELAYGAKSNEVLHPDFCLPHYLGKDKHLYIEHWGYNENNIAYTKTKKFKLPIYEKLGITLVCTYEKTDAKDIESALNRKLNKQFIIEGAVNKGDEE